MNSPFNITFGKEPENTIISRSNELKDIYTSFDSENPDTQVYILTGVRGSGKTVAMTGVRDYYRNNKDWICIDLNPESDMLEQLASKLFDEGNIRNIFVNKEFNFSFNGIGFSITNNSTNVSSASTFLSKELEHLKKKKKKVLITIDEVVSNSYMKVFAHEFQSFLRENYNVCLLMTGLYHNISKLEKEKSLTFLYRAPKIYIGELNIRAISNSYKKVFKLAEIESIKLAKYTNGYAYAYQLLGNLLFTNNKKQLDESIIDELDEILYSRAYSIIYSELTSKEKDILKVAAYKDTNKEIVDSINISNSQLSSYKKRLYLNGLIHDNRERVIFKLPRFKEFIRFMIEFEEE